MQALRRSGNWPAVLKLLDGPDSGRLRALALRALADRAEPVVVDGLIARLGAETRPGPASPVRRPARPGSTRSPGPWVYWGYRPAPRPANTVAWERTEAIAAGAGPRAGRPRPPPSGWPCCGGCSGRRSRPGSRRSVAGCEPGRGSDVVGVLIEALGEHPADERRGLLAEIVADRTQSRPTGSRRLALWPGGDEGSAQAVLAELAGGLEDGPVLAAALRRITKRSLPAAAPLVSGKLGSPDPDVRAAAVAVAGRLGLADAGEQVGRLLTDRDPGVRRAAAEAAGALGLKAAGDRLLELARDPDPGVRRAGLDALRRLREPRAVPLAVHALADRRGPALRPGVHRRAGRARPG